MSSILRTVLATTSLGAAAAFGIAGPAAATSTVPDGISRTDVPTGASAATEAVLDVAERLQLNPMNGGGLNPLSNTAGADVGGTPVGTGMVTDDLADGMTVHEALGSL